MSFFKYSNIYHYTLSIIPILIWSVTGLFYFMEITIPFYMEFTTTFLGWIITGIVVTFGYTNLKFLSHREKKIISISCFLNFVFFYIYKEFRSESIMELKIQYGITEAFMVINAVYFSPILLDVFRKNRAKINNKNYL